MRRGAWSGILVGSLAACYGWAPLHGDGRASDDDAARDGDGDATREDAADTPDIIDVALDGPCAIPDLDGDGWASPACGSSDCNDSDPTIFPGAPDNAERWTIETIRDPIRGGEVGPLDAVIGPDDLLHVLAVGSDPGWPGVPDMVCFRLEGGVWSREVVFPGEYVPEGRMALDARGVPHAVFERYADRDGTLRHVVREAAGSWRGEELARPFEGGPAGAFVAEAGGAIHVVGRADGGTGPSALAVASSGSGSWVIDRIDEDDINFADAAIVRGEDGRVHVAYVAGVPGGGELRHAVRGAGGWSIEVVTDRALRGPVALVLDGDGRPHMAAVGMDGALYASEAGGSWAVEPIDPESGGFGAALALDGDGRPHVAYGVLGWSLDVDLRYAWRTESGWVREEVLAGGLGSGVGIRFGLDGTGAAHLVFGSQHATNAGAAPPDGVDQDCDRVDG